MCETVYRTLRYGLTCRLPLSVLAILLPSSGVLTPYPAVLCCAVPCR